MLTSCFQLIDIKQTWLGNSSQEKCEQPRHEHLDRKSLQRPTHLADHALQSHLYDRLVLHFVWIRITYHIRVGGMCCAPLWKVLISKYTWSRFSNINGDMALKKRVLLQNNRGFNFWKALCPHQNVSPFKPMNYNNLSRRVLNHRGPNYFDKQGSSNRFSCISFK